MTAPSEAQLDDLAAALIPTLVRVSEYGYTLPEPEPKPRRHRRAVMRGVLFCANCGQRIRDHGLTGYPA